MPEAKEGEEQVEIESLIVPAVIKIHEGLINGAKRKRGEAEGDGKREQEEMRMERAEGDVIAN